MCGEGGGGCERAHSPLNLRVHKRKLERYVCTIRFGKCCSCHNDTRCLTLREPPEEAREG